VGTAIHGLVKDPQRQYVELVRRAHEEQWPALWNPCSLLSDPHSV
jgi:hypothetical protein